METQAPLKVGGEKLIRNSAFEWLARAGLAARGIVYVMIGILAIKLALGSGGTGANQQGALQTIAAQPLGNVLLVLVSVGLGGYALWRLTRALLGHGPECLLRAAFAQSRGNGANRLRHSLAQRRPLPPHLDQTV